MKFGGFDWDAGNREKCQKHGVGLEEIESLIVSGPAIYPDHEHSSQEDRVRAIGRVSSGRWVFLAFTFRERDGVRLIRPISARYMHPREVKFYEAAIFKPEGSSSSSE